MELNVGVALVLVTLCAVILIATSRGGVWSHVGGAGVTMVILAGMAGALRHRGASKQ